MIGCRHGQFQGEGGAGGGVLRGTRERPAAVLGTRTSNIQHPTSNIQHGAPNANLRLGAEKGLNHVSDVTTILATVPRQRLAERWQPVLLKGSSIEDGAQPLG